jgi:hypothetical protein
MKVVVNLYGNANKEAGWNSRDFELDRQQVTILDVLRLAGLPDGHSLADLIADGDRLRDDYAIFLSGRLLEHPTDLRAEVNNGDDILVLDFPFTLGGG